MSEPMRIAYADPPYPGQAAKHYADHPDYAGEVDHRRLLWQLREEYDGWILHTSSVALPLLIDQCDELAIVDYRIAAWVKPFAAFKRNVSVAYAWEPVLIKTARKPVVSGRIVMRDWIAEPITLRRGLAGAKPEAVCRWAFEIVGAEPQDQLDDLFPGTGAVMKAWERWRSSLQLAFNRCDACDPASPHRAWCDCDVDQDDGHLRCPKHNHAEHDPAWCDFAAVAGHPVEEVGA